jgi:hypothetical protein
MTTITASTTAGIDLNPTYFSSPVSIDAGVTVSNPAYPYAVYAHPGATNFFVIDNNGAITSSKTGAMYLAPGGALTNATSASIVGPGEVRRCLKAAGRIAQSPIPVPSAAYRPVGAIIRAVTR